MKTLSIFATALLFMGVSTLTAGQETEKSQTANQEKTQVAQQATGNVQRPYFVDEDKNGVCDNYETGNRRMGQRMGRGQGLGRCGGRGAGFGRGAGDGRGAGFGGRGGNGNFVDTDKDGVCDNVQNGTGPQRLRDGSGRAIQPEKNN